MKTLNAKDIEKLENTSVASAAMAATMAADAMSTTGPCGLITCGVSDCGITNIPTGLSPGASTGSPELANLLRQALR